ncbi:MAG: MOSC domain-containing protein [Betaproteobacteria bacterium]|nr:MAG: MOSC domain-containing protein [Betaproteobacteria bacterium]
MSDVELSLSSLFVHPVKSCAGIAVDESLLIETGLEFDRAWMVVDEMGGFVSQRELPRMALIQPSLRTHDLLLRAPGMLGLHLALDAVEAPCRVRVWDDEVAAYDMVRLVRFDPEQRRLSSRQWTGALEAENAFSDGFPLLVASTASLAELNRRLAERGLPPVTMQRFRPNLVLDGLDAHGEDWLDEIVLDGPDGAVRLKVVKPCGRCTIPSVDPSRGEQGHEPGDTLSGYRPPPRSLVCGVCDCQPMAFSILQRELFASRRGRATPGIVASDNAAWSRRPGPRPHARPPSPLSR